MARKKIGPNDPCPCGQGLKLKKCCQRLHAGTPPPTAEALMRARYTAYAVGAVDFLMRTTHPASPHFRADAAAWRAELRDAFQGLAFDHLTIHGTTTAPDGQQATVHFTAHLLRADGTPAALTENSRFLRVGGAWKYVDGLPLSAAPPG